MNKIEPLQTHLPNPWWVLAALTIMMVTLNLDLAVANLALAPIAKDLHIDMVSVQWIINGCIIASAIAMPIAGRLGDIFGLSRIFLIGAAIFLVASIAAGAAQNSTSIIGARIIQGFGIALSFPMIYALIFRIFPETQRGIATGIITAGNGFAQAIGPTVGGILIHLLNWRWVFFINIPLVISACLILVVNKPAEIKANHSMNIDKSSMLLLSTGLFILMITLNKAQYWGLTSIYFLTGFIGSLILLTIFGWYQTQCKNPLLDMRLFANKRFMLVTFIRMLFNSVFFVVLFTMGLMLQNIFSYSANKAGLIMLFMTVIFGVISPICGRWIDKTGVHIPLSIGMGSLTLACILLAGIGFQLTLPVIGVALFLTGITCGIMFPTTSVAALSSVRKEQTGMASGLFYTAMFISCAVGVAMAGFILSTVSAAYINHALINATLTHHELILLNAVASGIQSITSITNTGLQAISYQAFITAFQHLMQWCLGFALLGFLISLYLHRTTSYAK